MVALVTAAAVAVGSDYVGGRGWEQGTAAAVTSTATEAGTQSFAGTAEEGRGNEKCEC